MPKKPKRLTVDPDFYAIIPTFSDDAALTTIVISKLDGQPLRKEELAAILESYAEQLLTTEPAH